MPQSKQFAAYLAGLEERYRAMSPEERRRLLERINSLAPPGIAAEADRRPQPQYLRVHPGQ